MKILHLLYESLGDSFGMGGVGTRAYEIYGKLKKDHDITLLCKKYPGAKDRDIEGLRHLFVGRESGSLTVTLLSYGCESARFVRSRGNDFDIIIEEFSPAIPSFSHAVAAVPVVLQVQGHTGRLYFRKYNPLYAGFLCLMEALRPRLYRNFIFVSEETMKKIRPGKGSNLSIIPNGVSPSLFEAGGSEGRYVLYLGRIDIYGKGLDTLLQAYEIFSVAFPGARLVIAGDGRDREEFMSLTRKLPDKARKTISFPGWVSGSRKMEIIRGASFAVFPSRHEVQPIAVLEAMACGKPVVVSSIPEFGFVGKSGAGLSFETGDPRSLAEAMLRLSNDAEAAEKMGEKARMSVRDLTWDRIAARYEDFLVKVLEGAQDIAGCAKRGR